MIHIKLQLAFVEKINLILLLFKLLKTKLEKHNGDRGTESSNIMRVNSSKDQKTNMEKEIA